MAGKLASTGGGKRGRIEVTADPNVIPFIDVMLVLLIIFMIAAPISTVDIQVAIPRSQIDPSKRPPRPTWISVKEDGGAVHFYVMNDEVPIADLGTKTMEAWRANTPGNVSFDDCLLQASDKGVYCRVYIRADNDLPYRNVVLVMNRLQDQGFSRIGFVAEDRRN